LTPSLAIHVLQQNLSVSAPSAQSQFAHHLALLNHKSDGQRKESLAHLTAAIKDSDQLSLPLPASIVISKIKPVLLDSSSVVRNQAIKLLEYLPPDAVVDNAEQLLLYSHVTLTHLSPGFRIVGLDLLEWLLNVAGKAVVTAPGGWIRTLECLLSVLGWSTSSAKDNSGWNTTVTGSRTGDDDKTKTRGLQVLAMFLQTGLSVDSQQHIQQQHNLAADCFPLTHPWDHSISQNGNPFGYLGLFEESAGNMRLEEVVDRQRFFTQSAAAVVSLGIDQMKKEGGRVGRASVEVERAIKKLRGF
jgi:pre-rRNA-processing protein IPI1